MSWKKGSLSEEGFLIRVLTTDPSRLKAFHDGGAGGGGGSCGGSSGDGDSDGNDNDDDIIKTVFLLLIKGRMILHCTY